MTRRCLIVASLIASAACAAQRPALPLPQSVTAVCSAGLYGGGRLVTVRTNGEVRTERTGPNEKHADSLVRRDSARVHALLDRAARLPWADLRSVENLHDMQCVLVATWPDTTRRVRWFPEQPPSELASAAKLHEDVVALAAAR